jgi:hypothetical protein
VIGGGWDDFRRSAGIANDVFLIADDVHRLLTEQWAQLPDPSRAIVRNSRAIYTNILFPDCKRSADVAEQKLDLVVDALEGDDETAAALWRLLKTAVWRAPTPAAPRTAPDEATIDRIRTTTLGILGIPLVRRDCLEFDLKPPA